MPTYEYRCPAGHEFELFQKMTDKPRAKCPTCGKVAVRKISAGAGLVFKGSGFYITDYGKDGKGPRKAEAESAPAATESSAKPAESGGAKADKADAPKKAEKTAKKKGAE
jgi:putative FmdB family regulatory protein